jgi:hypothetical protein
LAPPSSVTPVLTRATLRNIPEDAILHSHRCENLKLISALQSTDRYGFSSLNDYQFVSQEILCSFLLLYAYHYINI